MKNSVSKKETISTRLNSDLLTKLRHLHVDERKPVNSLLEEAIELLLKKYGRK